MNNFIGFAGVGSAIIASMGLAMWLEWFCLSWLMRVMPGREGIHTASATAVSASGEIAAEAIEPKQAEPEMAVAPPRKSTRNEIRLGI
ncbi:MAG: hypothetical protein WB780_15750 [Candidatus Acidiferrales bacterium]